MKRPSFEAWIMLRAGYPYLVSSNGRVKSFGFNVKCHNGMRNTGERMLEPCVRNGYPSVRLNISGKFKWYTIHRLVSECFNPNINNLPQVNHKDTYKTNNYFGNLEWCTQSQNTQHAYDTGVLKPARNRLGFNGVMNIASIPVAQVDFSGNVIRTFESINLTKNFGFIPSCVGRVCKNQLLQHKGYRFIHLSQKEEAKKLFVKV